MLKVSYAQFWTSQWRSPVACGISGISEWSLMAGNISLGQSAHKGEQIRQKVMDTPEGGRTGMSVLLNVVTGWEQSPQGPEGSGSQD